MPARGVAKWLRAFFVLLAGLCDVLRKDIFFMNGSPTLGRIGLLLRLAFVMLLAVFCLSAHTVFAREKTSPPNIILIVADYMGYADIGPYGAEDIKTPALDFLAAGGVTFSNNYTAAPMCIPARASLMSGLYPAKVLARFNAGNGREKGLGLHARHNNLLSQLKAGGYATGLVGKWHLGSGQNFKPNDHGFDYFYGFDAWTLGYHDHRTSDGDAGLYRNSKLVNEKGYLTHLFSDEAVSFIDKNASDPFFLYLSYNTGLPPYQGPDLPASKWGGGWEPNDASRADYIAMVEAMDQGIGSVLDKLRTLKLEENTLVIFTYDHGGATSC